MLYSPTLIAIIEVLIIIVPVSLVLAFVTVAERKTMASMQRRLSPNLVGYYGLLQEFADTLKLILKEYVSPTQANLILFFLGPVIILIFALLGYAVVHYRPGLGLWNFNLGILYMFAVSSLATYGILLACLSANSKYDFLGSSFLMSFLLVFLFMLIVDVLNVIFLSDMPLYITAPCKIIVRYFTFRTVFFILGLEFTIVSFFRVMLYSILFQTLIIIGFMCIIPYFPLVGEIMFPPLYPMQFLTMQFLTSELQNGTIPRTPLLAQGQNIATMQPGIYQVTGGRVEIGTLPNGTNQKIIGIYVNGTPSIGLISLLQTSWVQGNNPFNTNLAKVIFEMREAGTNHLSKSLVTLIGNRNTPQGAIYSDIISSYKAQNGLNTNLRGLLSDRFINSIAG